MSANHRVLSWLWVCVLLLLFSLSPVEAQAQHKVLLLTYDGPVTPVMLAYLERGEEQAQKIKAEAIIFQLDTPGGSVDLTRQISQLIQRSSVPVIVYVAPARAWAASAGTIITLSGHLAVMAPETFIGAASPVGGSGEDLNKTMKEKVNQGMSDRKSTRLNSSHIPLSRMPSSA